MINANRFMDVSRKITKRKDGTWYSKDTPLLASLFQAALTNKLSHEQWLKTLSNKLLKQIIAIDYIKELTSKEKNHDKELFDITGTVFFLMVYREMKETLRFDSDEALVDEMIEGIVHLQSYAFMELNRRAGRLDYSIPILDNNKWKVDGGSIQFKKSFFEYALNVIMDPDFAKSVNMNNEEIFLWKKHTETLIKIFETEIKNKNIKF